MDRHAEWLRIEAEAREQVAAEVEALTDTPLEYGHHIAWVDCRYARTEGISDVHRVGFPQKHEPYTSCGEQIPHPTRWLSLSPAMIRTMVPCRFCAAEQMRHAREDAA